MRLTLYLILLLGITIATIGMILVLGYGLVRYTLTPLKDFVEISIDSSRWFFLVAIFTVATGFCISFYTLEKSAENTGMVFLSMSLVLTGFSFFIQIWRMIATGLAWIGVEILGNQGNVKALKVFSVGFAIFTLLVFTLCFLLMREGRMRN